MQSFRVIQVPLKFLEQSAELIDTLMLSPWFKIITYPSNQIKNLRKTAVVLFPKIYSHTIIYSL